MDNEIKASAGPMAPLPASSLRGRGFWAGIIAGVTMVSLMWLFNIFFGHYTLPQVLDPIIVKLLPGQAFEQGIQTAGQAAHALEVIVIVIALVLTGGLLGMLYATLFGGGEAKAANEGRVASLSSGLLKGLSYAVVIYLLFYGLLIPTLEKTITSDSQTYRGIGVFGSNIPNSGFTQEGLIGFVLMSLAVFLAYGLTLGGVFSSDVRATTAAWHQQQASNRFAMPARRRALRQIGGGAAVIAAGLASFNYISGKGLGLGRAGSDNSNVGRGSGVSGSPVAQAGPMDTPEAAASRPTAAAQPTTAAANLSDAGMPAQQTPTANFYHVSKNTSDPVISSNGWTLSIEGLVDKPYKLTYEQLLQQPSLYRYLMLSCISNPIGGNLIGNAKWKGTPLKGLLEKAGVQAGARRVVFICGDDYTDSIAIETALHDYNLLAWEMNGEKLPSDHGAPARLLVPGIYGMKNVKWLRTIRVIDDANYKGFWQAQGWDNPAPTRTMATFYIPATNAHRMAMIAAEPLLVGGVSYAGDRGISKVEVSTDEGKTWQEAALRTPLSPYAWVHWTWAWTPTKGNYTLKCRATDGAGKVQLNTATDAYPAGAEAYDAIQVQVS